MICINSGGALGYGCYSHDEQQAGRIRHKRLVGYWRRQAGRNAIRFHTKRGDVVVTILPAVIVLLIARYWRRRRGFHSVDVLRSLIESYDYENAPELLPQGAKEVTR